jgi:large subunit ribosomal protein L19
MMDEIIRAVEESQASPDLPDFEAGDTVNVHYEVTEGDKVRTQMFGGVVISRRGAGAGATFTIRKISHGIGVERIFPLHSPKVLKLDVVRRGKVRRAKLFYLRDKKGKAARIREKR